MHRLLLPTVSAQRALLATLSGVALTFGVAHAEARITGMSGNGCTGCHASNEDPPTISLEVPEDLSPGERVALRLTIQATGIQGGGFYLRTENGDGTFEAGAQSKLSGDGLTHSVRKPASGGAVTFDFWWTAPSDPGGSRFRISAVSANNNNSRSGDVAGDQSVDVVYGCTAVDVYRDYDLDGFGGDYGPYLKCGPSEGFSATNDDCNDRDVLTYPGATEICNQKDDNCNTDIDEGTEQVVFFRDDDGDGHGVPGEEEVFTGCALQPGLAPNDDDCDDADPLHYPNAVELCNGQDDNCNEEADEELLVTCGVGECARSTVSCFDYECLPGLPQTETCNGLDDDCDGFVDDEDNLCEPGQVCTVAGCEAGTEPPGSGEGGSAPTTGGEGGAPEAGGSASAGNGGQGGMQGAAGNAVQDGGDGGSDGIAGSSSSQAGTSSAQAGVATVTPLTPTSVSGGCGVSAHRAPSWAWLAGLGVACASLLMRRGRRLH